MRKAPRRSSSLGMDMKSSDPDGSLRGRKSAPAIARSGGVQSLNRALFILETLAANEDGLSLTALAKTVALPPSSAHRLLTTLQRKRFVRFEPGAMTWRIGVQAFVVGSAFARSREVAPLAMPYMRQLMEKTGETVNLYVPNAGQAICIAQVQSRQVVRAIDETNVDLVVVDRIDHGLRAALQERHVRRVQVGADVADQFPEEPPPQRGAEADTEEPPFALLPRGGIAHLAIGQRGANRLRALARSITAGLVSPQI